jgi:protein regulator of cytokinesis 1
MYYSLSKTDKANTTLKEHFLQLHPQLEELRKKKDERLKKFEKVKEEIHGILVEIAVSVDIDDAVMFSSAAEEDLSLRKLDDYISHLHALEREKVCIDSAKKVSIKCSFCFV